MNCRAAQRLLSADRDDTLASSERAALEAHVAGCADCRRERAVVAGAVESWRAASKRVAIPDSERAWQDIRREIRTTGPTNSPEHRGLPRWVFPAVVAAALVFAATLAPRWLSDAGPPATNRLEIARADFVETASDTSSMVYVDDKSGWLVIWAVNDRDKM